MGILTIGVVTKPFHFESGRRMRVAEAGIAEMQKAVDTLIVIPNQNLFRVANEKTTFADAFAMADQVLCSGVACITDLMVKKGLVNLDFADVCSIMYEMGTAMIGVGEANPLLDETSMQGARGLLISITGGDDLTLFELDEAASRIREEVDDETNIIVGATFDPALGDAVRVSVVATGIDRRTEMAPVPGASRTDLSLQPDAEPVLDTDGARAFDASAETHPPPAAAVIPFPGLSGRRKGFGDEEPLEGPQANRYPSVLERLGASVGRASGWR
jgi:cell division protein FtsZ